MKREDVLAQLKTIADAVRRTATLFPLGEADAEQVVATANAILAVDPSERDMVSAALTSISVLRAQLAPHTSSTVFLALTQLWGQLHDLWLGRRTADPPADVPRLRTLLTDLLRWLDPDGIGLPMVDVLRLLDHRHASDYVIQIVETLGFTSTRFVALHDIAGCLDRHLRSEYLEGNAAFEPIINDLTNWHCSLDPGELPWRITRTLGADADDRFLIERLRDRPTNVTLLELIRTLDPEGIGVSAGDVIERLTEPREAWRNAVVRVAPQARVAWHPGSARQLADYFARLANHPVGDHMLVPVKGISNKRQRLWTVRSIDSMPVPSRACWGHALTATAERWNGTFVSRADAISDGRRAYGTGERFWVRSGTSPDPARFVPDADDIVDLMAERARDEAGEAADEYPDVSQAAMRELEAYLQDWARKYAPVRFWIEDGRPAEEVVPVAADATVQP